MTHTNIEQQKRIQQGIEETTRLLDKELAYSVQHRDQCKIASYKEHLDKLNMMLAAQRAPDVTVGRHTKEFRAVIDTCNAYTVFSLQNFFNGELVTGRKLPDAAIRNGKLRTTATGYCLRVHSNLWYEFERIDLDMAHTAKFAPANGIDYRRKVSTY
jgi:hypothetical protein